jgi:sugar/nucleoside kinase (ribokinase family)
MPGQYNRVIGVVPSIIDAHHFYDTTLEWQASLDALRLTPGEWAEVDGSEEQYQALAALPTPCMKAESSILAAMAVLPEGIKRHSVLYATRAYDDRGCEALGSVAFRDSAKQWGITTGAIPLQGGNPTVHVLVDPLSGERSFLKDPRVSRDIGGLPEWEQSLTDSTIVSLDAYELTDGKTGETLRSVIESASGTIALSLGNVAILGNELTGFIHRVGSEGRLHSLFGNEDEFTALLGTPLTERQLLEAQQSLGATLAITRGNKGISVVMDGNHYHANAPQFQAHNIISTSGAGDAAMGVILGGLIENEAIDTLLGKATAHCARVIQTADDIVPR